MSEAAALLEVLEDLIDTRVQHAVARALERHQATADDGAVKISTAAQLLDVGESTVRRLVAAGELPTVDIGEVAHIRRTDLARYLDEQAVRAARRRIADQARQQRRRRGRATA